MQSINFEMINKGLKPSRSARQLQETLSQEFLNSTDQSNTLKFGSTTTTTTALGINGNQSNKFAFRPSGDSDQCDTHHSEEVHTLLEDNDNECDGVKPSHFLNILPVADIRRDSFGSSQQVYQVYNKNNNYEMSANVGNPVVAIGDDDMYSLNNQQQQQYLTNSQFLEQLKKHSSNNNNNNQNKPPLSRHNSTANNNNKDEITQFRGTEQCIAMNNNTRRTSNPDEESYIKQKVLINLKDLNDYDIQRNNNNNLNNINDNMQKYQQNNQQNQQTFVSHTIESHRITPNKIDNNLLYSGEPCPLMRNDVIGSNKENNSINNNNVNHNQSQQKDSSYNEWVKECAAANIPFPLQRVSSPQRIIQYQEQNYFSASQQNQQQQKMMKQNDECCESLKPEDLLMSQQEYNKFQQMQKQLNSIQQLQSQQQQLSQNNLIGNSSNDSLINNLTLFQGNKINIIDQMNQQQQQLNYNEIIPICINNQDMSNSKSQQQQQQNQPSHFNFNSTYSFSNNQFQQCLLLENQQLQQQQQQQQQYNNNNQLQESGFNPEQQLNSISSSSILNIQSPKSNTISQPLTITPQILQKESDKENVSIHLQNMKDNILNSKKNNNNNNVQKKDNNNKNPQFITSTKPNLKRNYSVSNINQSPLNQTTNINDSNKNSNNKIGKRSLHENIDQMNIINKENNPMNLKENKRSTTPTQTHKILERKMSDNLLLDKSKKKIQSYEEQQLQECTFKPQINKSSQLMQRTFNQFLDSQNIFNKNKFDQFKNVQHQDQLKCGSNEMEVKEKPEISKESQRIIEQKRNQDQQQQSLFGGQQIVEQQTVHNRLYSFHKKNESSHSQNRKKIEEEVYQENTFKPQIHQRSKSIKRDEKIEDLLYKDAQRRNNIQQNIIQNSKPRSNSKYLSEKSEKILLKKFMKEMEFIINSLVIVQSNKVNSSALLNNNNNNQQNISQLDMASLFEIMIKSGFIKYNQNNINDNVVQENEKKLIFLMWTLLGGKQYQYISKENLLFFFLIILNLEKSIDNSVDRQIIFKDLSYSLSHASQSQTSNSQTPSPMASQTSLKNFKNFETFTSLISSNANQQNQQNNNQGSSTPISPLNKSPSSSLFSSPTNLSLMHNQLNTQLMKQYHENYINISLGTFDDKQSWIVNDEDKAVIRQAFELFYRNRLSYEELKSQKNPQELQCTFHPNILNSSKQMANQYREKLLIQTANLLENKEIQYQVPKDGKIQHSDFLILQKRAQEVQNKSKQAIEKEKELIECSFKPQISQNIKQNISDQSSLNIIALKKTDELYQQSKGKENKPLKNTNEIEYEKQKNECTFQPELKENRFKKNYEGGIYAKNVNKTIERMRNARKDREVINVMKQRGYNSINQVNRHHQKSNSSNSLAQDYQSNELNQTNNNTKKDDSMKSSNSNSNSQIQSSHTQDSRINKPSFYSNHSSTPSATVLNTSSFNNQFVQLQQQQQLLQPNSSFQPLQPDNQFQQQQQQQFNHNNNDQYNQQYSSLSQISSPSSNQSLYQQPVKQLLTNNMFANQAIQQYTQKNLQHLQNLQHSFAQQQQSLSSPTYNQMNNINNFNDGNDNNNINTPKNNYISGEQQQEVLFNNQQINNPLLELSAPKFGNIIQNSWTQSNYTPNIEQQQQQFIQPQLLVQQQSQQILDENRRNNNNSDKGQETASSIPDSKDLTPLLFVDVNLGNSRNERIIVNEEDNPKQLAYDFARLHGLDDQTAEKLFKLLENQIAGLLSRIEEEDNISHLENLD